MNGFGDEGGDQSVSKVEFPFGWLELRERTSTRTPICSLIPPALGTMSEIELGLSWGIGRGRWQDAN
jgi:hypothetical protein